MRRAPPTQERLRELFSYDPETGVFTRLVTTSSMSKAGSPAGWDCGGYIGIGVDGKWYLAHVLAWVYMTGSHPPLIDHADLNGMNNKFSNLRAGTKSVNAANSLLRSDNTSGFKGVSWSLARRKWEAYIGYGKKISIGHFPTKEAAVAARSARAKETFGEFAREA